MAIPATGDLLIRNQNSFASDSTYVVIDAVTHVCISGPFATLREATASAAALAGAGACIWQENMDLRGRTLGSPMRLPIRPNSARRAQSTSRSALGTEHSH